MSYQMCGNVWKSEEEYEENNSVRVDFIKNSETLIRKKAQAGHVLHTYLAAKLHSQLKRGVRRGKTSQTSNSIVL